MAGKPVSPASGPISDTTGVASRKPVSKVYAAGVDRRDAGWDVRHGPRNYVSLISAQTASAVLSFAAVWLATRLLGSTGYGGVVAIIAASQAIGQLAVNWTSVKQGASPRLSGRDSGFSCPTSCWLSPRHRSGCRSSLPCSNYLRKLTSLFSATF